MIPDPLLSQLYTRSTRIQTLTFKAFAAVCALAGGVFLLLPLVMPHKKGDLPAMIVVLGFGAVMLLSAPGFWWYANRLGARLRRLLASPSEITDMKLINAKARNGPSVWSIHLIDRAGTISGLLVPDEATGKKTMSHLRELGSGTRR